LAAFDSGRLKPQVLATVLGLTIDFPLPDQDVCANLIFGGCPLSEGDEATYQLIMPILNEYPLVSLSIQFSVLDETDQTLVCFEVDGQVVEA
jgi:ML domain